MLLLMQGLVVNASKFLNVVESVILGKLLEHAASSIIESFLLVTDAIFSWKDHVFTRRYKYILWTRVHIGELFSLFSSVFFALFYLPQVLCH